MTRASKSSARAVGLVLGYAADRVFGDPQEHHPVAWSGTAVAALERRMWAPTRARGVGFLGIALTPPVLATALFPRQSWIRQATVVAATTWIALGGRSLEREASAVHELLQADDIEGARARIRSLVGRDVTQAGADDLARAVVESLAENQSDALAATLVWGALAGAPGVVLHRCANTLDAMVGHHNERYEHFGWASARFDDVLNWLPSRISTAATVLCAGSWSRTAEAIRVVRRDAHQHPSPNAGPVEAAAAGALGVRLGGRNVYGKTVEDRGQLGDGRVVRPQDIPAAVALERRVARGVLTTCCLALGTVSMRSIRAKRR